ncbi:hypothetical protein E2566_18920 [Pectobacterium punjabense]|uniref:Uncharacterized protein n=1 Tax=Pectobacterium punjabense TaxID=2108399 RepID=A0ABX6L6G2_9GAMM|nr:hypothetical protein [Pectobacterium punjabense]MBS4433355.1 hypothetical protein [Pectobacterium punjabense]QJA21834.1 hypothetical protein E2566_18920 [Pectobacterium punjabense]
MSTSLYGNKLKFFSPLPLNFTKVNVIFLAILWNYGGGSNITSPLEWICGADSSSVPHLSWADVPSDKQKNINTWRKVR